MESIAIDSLPQTLKDAISSTRMLGCRYIWIDALCIIQDDPEDWQREAANTCSMYENAVLSLSILDAEGCNNGFLRSMPLAEDVDRNGSGTSIGLGRSVKNPAISALEASVLETRAWTLQERTIAPAVLHFAADRMIWECCYGSAWCLQPNIKPKDSDQYLVELRRVQSRSHTSRAPRADLGIVARGASPYDIFAIRSMLGSAARIDALNLWYALVVDYTRRRITYNNDRPEAINGLAKRFQRCVAGLYTAGLWSTDLHQGLL